VAAEKDHLNFNVLAVVKREFNAMAGKYGEREKWAVCSAAVLLLLELPPKVREAYIEQVFAGAATNEAAETLITRAKAGELRREADKRRGDAGSAGMRSAASPWGPRSGKPKS
jgi:hypothetical protein